MGQTIMIDKLNYTLEVNVTTPDTDNTNNLIASGIVGNQVDYYVYQYPIQLGYDATLNAQTVLKTSPPVTGRLFGRTSFSVDAAIFGYAIVTYDGVDPISGNGHPCGNKLIHLDDDIGCLNPNVATPGLQLDLSNKYYFAFELSNLDQPSGVNFIFRVWDNSGITGFSNYIHPTVVITNIRPLVIIPLKLFTNANLINWSNIRAISYEFNSTNAGTDSIIGPIEILGYNSSKSSSTLQPVAPSNVISFDVKVDIDKFLSNNLQFLSANITHDVIITDTLPFELDFSNSPIVITDQFNNPINFTSTIVGKLLTIQISNLIIQDVRVSYSTITVSPYSFCTKTVCNNAVITVVTKFPSLISFSNQYNSSVCVDLKAQPLITTTYDTCPTSFSNTTFQTISRVCNNGNGLAKSINFISTTLNSLSQCNPIFPTGTCSATSCSKNIGDLASGDCVNVPITYDCSSLGQTCTPLSFNSSFNASENCVSSTSISPTCSFSFDPIPANVQITNTCPANITPSNLSTQLVSQVCNNGLGLARNVVFTHTSQGSLVNCTATIGQGNCAGPTCTRNIGVIPSNQCVQVTIDYDCSSFSQNCSTLSFPSTVSAVESCTTIQPKTCSFNLVVQSPNVQITNTCPTDITPSNLSTQLVSQVCNNGLGLARNVVFTHTSQGSLVNCTATIGQGNCAGPTCTRSIGDIPSNQCVQVTIDYDCSTYSQKCSTLSFPSTVSAVESCTAIQPKTCSFNLVVQSPNLQITNTCPSNISPSNLNTVLISNVCNIGTGMAKNVIFTTSGSSPTTSSCFASINQASCNGVSCSTNLGDLASNDCISVDVNLSCAFSNSCANSTLPIVTSASDNCKGKIPGVPCSFKFTPGISNVQITNSCPANIDPSNLSTQLVSQVCNTGNGMAKNVVFTHISRGSLVNCVSKISQGSCVGSICQYNIGDLPVDTCVPVTIDYDCSSITTGCSTLSFPSTVSAVGGCNSIQQKSCLFNLIVPTPNLQIQNTCPSVPTQLNPNTVLSSRVCNFGNGISKNVIFTTTSSSSVSLCSAIIDQANCNGVSCSKSLGDLLPNQCVIVDVNLSCSSLFTPCNPTTVPITTSASDSCNRNIPRNTCSFVLPGTSCVTGKGEKGDKGIRGKKGEKGENGEKGIRGPRGRRGEKGDKGDKGKKGSKGAKGESDKKEIEQLENEEKETNNKFDDLKIIEESHFQNSYQQKKTEQLLIKDLIKEENSEKEREIELEKENESLKNIETQQNKELHVLEKKMNELLKKFK